MINDNDLISIVVPIYNVEKYLKKCVDSIINQTYKELEIILVDDGSPDNCGRICDEYAKKDSRIKVIHKENGGLSDARNVGIDICNGKYITFVDSDDYVLEDYVEYLYNMIKKYNTEMSISPYYIEINEKKVEDIGEKYKETILGTEECLSRMLCEKGFTVSANAKMYKRELFKDVKYPVSKLCEDNGTTYKLIRKCDNIAYGNTSKYVYVQRENSIMNSKFDFKRMDLIELTDIMAEELIKDFPNIKDSIIRRKIYARFSILRQVVLKNGEKEKKITKEIKKDIMKNYKKEFFSNRKLDTRDKIAFISLFFGLRIFKISWKIYMKLKNKGEI